MTILVTGATGNIGRHVVTGLRERGATVRAMSRSSGHGTTAGDLTRPDTLHDALSDVDSVFLLWPFLSAEGIDEVLRVIARHARRVVYVSALSAEHGGVWSDVEAAIRRSGLEWTFLRPGGFATNTLEWVPAIRAGRPARLPYPEAGRSLVHERDIADIAVLALTEDGHVGETYALTGPEVLTQAEQVRILGEAAGRRATVEELTPDEARADLLAWASEEFADSALAYWQTLVDHPEPVIGTYEKLTGRPSRTFTRWAHDHAGDLGRLSPAEVADRYVTAFRTGTLDQALELFAPDAVRVAPLEHGGEHVELRGVGAILANAERIDHDLEIRDVTVDGPYPHGDRFAVRFTFDHTHVPTGSRSSVTKMSLYTVTNGAITREEVFYLDSPAG
ncbi:nuclear transport factor 2 family protein [Actinophytocola oryzae]|uniref:Uncharacterized protein YbjT (DUF2867 family) n=1 Tax=Actinophytocola oryzae TaxID=502181 RepID=A0A4R7W404_9PSEU|nr:NAD(P)H-binding protein [Actinophytocola oryzae]TDV57222.1 uncharacterized protein YbjT (DUF2867 family) [Actinophytocola oryzae]